MIDFFTDPVLRAPLFGSILMCISSALIGAIVLIRKHALIGETLSHASYPGVVIGALVSALLFPKGFHISILVGGALSAFLGLLCINTLERKLKVNKDASLCFVLASFFGIGLLIASRMQITHTLFYKQIQAFLYGQVATMTDTHIALYGLFTLSTCGLICLLYRMIQWTYFDTSFVKSVGSNTRYIDLIISLMLIFSIVIGIRSAGVVLMSGMLIAPPLAARQCTHKLSTLFFLSGCFGAASGFFGTLLSLYIPGKTLPTGPMILLFSSFLCLMTLFCAPKKGFITRALRILRFKNKCRTENFLKALWKAEGICEKNPPSAWLLWRLKNQGWIIKEPNGTHRLTEDGSHKAAQIVRLHRLWEAYLVHLGQKADKVHPFAEHMEHILTPQLEKELLELLDHPDADPHAQPIPQRRL